MSKYNKAACRHGPAAQHMKVLGRQPQTHLHSAVKQTLHCKAWTHTLWGYVRRLGGVHGLPLVRGGVLRGVAGVWLADISGALHLRGVVWGCLPIRCAWLSHVRVLHSKKG